MTKIELKVNKPFNLWNPKLLDEQLAPSISKFTSASIISIEDKYPDSKHWIQNLFLNSLSKNSYKREIRPTIIQCLRRVSASFRYYHEGKRLTDDYLTGNNVYQPKSREYFLVVDCWEAFFLQSQIFMQSYNRLKKFADTGEKAFQKKDGTKEQRLYDISDCIKHGVNPDEPWNESWMPLWLSNDGFVSYNLKLSFIEACEILEDIANWANDMQNPSLK